MPKVPTGLNSFQRPKTNILPSATIQPARVKLSILDDKTNPELFKKYGEWDSIGCIFFEFLDHPTKNILNNIAFPLYPNQSTIPLQNEIVYLIVMPNNGFGNNPKDVSYYYFQPLNIWNSVHHNAVPDPNINSYIPESQKQDYQQTEVGVVRRVSDNSTEINLGNTFQEKLSIKNIQPYEGDVIYQGRWGQSLRFGSTVKNAKVPNTWSNSGENGDPITIIRNGQHNDNNDPWVPQVEDINKDVSSIYITSTQKLPIDVASKNYKSYSTSPDNPNQYSKNQIVLTSGRLLFNSKEDSILLSSEKTINLNSKESVNIDSPKTIIASKEVLLGDKNASESIILGDKFLDDLSQLLTQLIKLNTALAPLGAIAQNIPIESTNLTVKAQNMLTSLQSYKSKVSKTK